MTTRPLQFLRRGQPVALRNVSPDRTLLEVLREDLGCTGTKEGCGEGDCGACTVVLGEARDGQVHYSAVNSCIRLAHSVNGMALWTVEDLTEDPLIQPAARSAGPGTDMQVHADPKHRATTPTVRTAGLHPVQEAMVHCHGSQCGFCTPGFVMSLFGMYQNQVCRGETITREGAQEALSGNLCRCTGYRPILDAAQQMVDWPRVAVDETALLQKLKQLNESSPAQTTDSAYMSPTTLPALLAARAAHPGAQVVAGCTDVGLWITKLHKQYDQVLDVTRVDALRTLQTVDGHLRIGAAVTLTDAFAALTRQWPQLHTFATRFAGLPVRNSGTLGGNVANGSPIGDSMPLLIALGARVVLASVRGERSLALEDLYTGYRTNVMAADELLVRIDVPLPTPRADGSTELVRAYKISKRFDDDISAVCLAVALDVAGGTVQRVRIGAGGVAATPARARQTEQALAGQPWNADTLARAAAVLQAEFTPISDMRASGAYRRTVLGNLMQRLWLDSQGGAPVSLERFRLEEITP